MAISSCVDDEESLEGRHSSGSGYCRSRRGQHDYAHMVFCVNGTMQKGEYQVRVAEDGLSVSFVRAISSRSFDKKILRKNMGAEYRKSSEPEE